ncbi:MinD/ParA family protein [Arthrobacter sp. STN4]|uniref:MinD/ParA family ATP-binding protein n=1 Tax=Arthrobacter sp. STN4 TaxID=2923276 RepID=UPI00211A8579|nr:MinD/ParA family protein [Arthrobacter sp. STN4]MCQ9164285.1 MinD/ParA family protein [Arthrobacter sp. STN4]
MANKNTKPKEAGRPVAGEAPAGGLAELDELDGLDTDVTPASENLAGGVALAPAAADPASTGAVETITQVTLGTLPERPQTEPASGAVRATATSMPQTTVEPLEVPVQQGTSPRRQREDGPEPAAALTSDRLLNKVAAPPVGGWRLWLYKASFGSVNMGDSDKVRLERAQDNLIASRLGERTRFVPVLSRKGGVGKTTVTTLLGMVLADTREDRVIAMDANPDRGTLSDRSPGSADFTARNLVKDRFNVTTFSQLSNYVARDGSRLDVLASDTDPTVAQAFDDSDYRAVTDILSKYYSIVLTDSGTGMVHSVMKGTLEKADAVVLVSGGSVDEARLASETLSWLEAHGRHDLVANAIVVVNMSGGETQVDIAQIEEHFRSRVRNVLRIPYDKHLAEGSRVELAKLRPATRLAVKELASLVVTELQRR